MATGGHKIYPYLLRGVTVDRPDQAWVEPARGSARRSRVEWQAEGMDITCVPMARGFVYLAGMVDWYSRRVLAWRLSITMEAGFCAEALGEALARHGMPDVFDTDQGSQFTSQEFTGVLLQAGVAISMDGKGAWRDHVFVERLWRFIKYEEIYLGACDSVGEARASIGRYLILYNSRRPHSSLDRKTPDQASFDRLPQIAAA